MEWTQEKALELIDVYKKQEVIWDPKNALHYHKIRKQDAWEEVANEVGRPVDECKKKMECLLACLRREKMKMKKSIGTGKGSDEIYRSSWFAYESLTFILDKNKPRQTLNTLQNETTFIEDEEPGEAPQKTKVTEQNEFQPPLPPKKRKKVEDQRLEKAFELLAACSQKSEDECQHFGNMVAAKLRRYSESSRCAIQNEILGVFVKANTGFYDQLYPSPQVTTLSFQPQVNPPQHCTTPIQSSNSFPHSYSQSPSPSYSEENVDIRGLIE